MKCASCGAYMHENKCIYCGYVEYVPNDPLPSDERSKNICIDNCRLCIDNCPVGALDGTTANQKKCRSYAYGKTKRGFDTVECNVCRSICPMRYGEA